MEVVHSSRFNLVVSLLYDMKGSDACICIIITKNKMMGFDHISLSYFVYIMSSYLMHYFVCHELNT